MTPPKDLKADSLRIGGTVGLKVKNIFVPTGDDAILRLLSAAWLSAR